MTAPAKQLCKQKKPGFKIGTCKGELVAMTLAAGGNKMRKRLWCSVCGRPGSDYKGE